MNILVLDIENTVEWIDTVNEDGHRTTVTDNSPFNPKNKVINVHWRKIEEDVIGSDNHVIFHHNEYSIPDAPDALQEALDWADVLVGHNIKYDYMWLKQCGFRLPDKVYCTMVGEYILARGVHVPLSLEASAIRREVSHKKGALVEEYFNNRIGFEAMPLEVVLEYTDADVLSTSELFLAQQELFAQEENLTLNNIVDLMNEMLLFIVEIETNGIKIDLNKLDEVEEEFKAEREQTIKDMDDIVKQVMGDIPINLNSGVDMTKVVYSREIIDRKKHLEIFNIGPDKYPPYMSDGQFAAAVRKTTKVVKKAVAHHCMNCNGKGKKQRYKADGTPYKLINRCAVCGGRGYILTQTTQIAGLKLNPEFPRDASANGFAVAKEQMDRLISQAQEKNNLQAVEFLTKKRRLNALNTYLNSFVEGFRRWTRADGLLHPNFNQHVARTGRLSSTNPNFQNQPKGKKFPIRQCVISRFEGGSIIECDFSGLEFRVAGELSRDPQIIKDILDGKDIHRQTGSIVHQKRPDEVTKDERNEVKPHTFAPLYGAQGNNQPLHIKTYYEEFFNIYKRHGEWQTEQMESVIANGYVRTPSGREYEFPGTRRLRNGKVTNHTMIVNYPVQGFATGDIVPLACIRALRKFRELGLKSVLILTVHDSIVVDVYPGEERLVYDILHWATTGVVEEIKTRWNYEMTIPLASEQSIGTDWGNLEELHYDE